MGGMIGSIGPQMYPAALRVTGFTLGDKMRRPFCFLLLMVQFWCLLAQLVGAGSLGGVISSIGPQMYPSAVRVTGFTLGEATKCDRCCS
jgi:hypothetical protein